MFFNLFGKYLVSKNIITDVQLEELKQIQGKTRVKLGLIAISERLLTEAQTEEINRKQQIMDKRFGDIAVDLGYLTNEQVSHLLDLQGNAYMVFCQTMTDKEYMTLPEIESALNDFCNELNVSADDVSYVKLDDIDHIVPYYLPEKNSSVKEIILVAVRTINRIISSDISIEKGYTLDSFEAANYAYQPLEGDQSITTGFFAEDKKLLCIADAYAGEEFDVVDEDSLDAVAEFVNIINGLYATSLSYRKIKVELMPPILVTDKAPMAGSKFTILPITIGTNKVNLIIGSK